LDTYLEDILCLENCHQREIGMKENTRKTKTDDAGLMLTDGQGKLNEVAQQ